MKSYYAVKYGHVWRMVKAKSANEAANYLFGIHLSYCEDHKNLGTTKPSAVKKWRELSLKAADDDLNKPKHKEPSVKTLVVWWDIPETIKFISLNITPEQAKMLNRFNNNFINLVNTPENIAKEINDFFYDEEGCFKFDEIPTPIENEKFDQIILTGFAM